MSRWFSHNEFLCKCRNPQCPAPRVVSEKLLNRLDVLRDEYRRPIIVTSGLRCPAWNKQQGGVAGSEHETGEGADLRVVGSADRMDLVRAAIYSGFTRIGIGPTFVHVGVSARLPHNVMWTYYTSKEITA